MKRGSRDAGRGAYFHILIGQHKYGDYLCIPNHDVGCERSRLSSRLALAAELAAQAMNAIGPKRQVILLCDSWYPKAEVAALAEQFENLEMVCNARVDTVLYGLPPAKAGKKGRPESVGNGSRWMISF